jgi:DNA-binding transcriptional ArsR family regulator
MCTARRRAKIAAVTPTSDPPPLDAGELVGLLADDDRRKIVAALVLGASTTPELVRATGLEGRRVVRALNRLVSGGLVLDAEGDQHVLLEAAFQLAARAVAAARPVSDEHRDAPADEAKVLRAFVRDGRLISIPSGWAKRRIVLDWLAQRFEPGRRYSEAMVNLSLVQVHPDTAALRRYLVDDGFLSRDHGEYWRTGGRVDPDDETAPVEEPW